jgi:hypothetical protein
VVIFSVRRTLYKSDIKQESACCDRHTGSVSPQYQREPQINPDPLAMVVTSFVPPQPIDPVVRRPTEKRRGLGT